jgi:hypothetical protein
MPWAQFEEKEFEVAAAAELAISPAGYGPVFSSGQVLEKVLGYDAVAAPSEDHVIWRVLSVPRPVGVRLVRSHWAPLERPPAGRLPSTPISLVLQYKRPEYLYGATAKQWHLWRRPYLRFTVESRQQRVLLRLHRRLNDEALVRYASPAFWRSGELDAAVVGRTVLAQTGFVDPSQLVRHRVWTYTAPGEEGRANPGGARSRFETLTDVLGGRNRPIVPDQTATAIVVSDVLGQHLQRVAAAVAVGEPRLRGSVERWALLLREQVSDLTTTQFSAVVSVAMIVTMTSAYRASWYVV